jgi:hypothetical protein
MDDVIPKNTSIRAILTRIYWFAFGHVFLIYLAISLFENKPGLLKSIIYFFLIGLLVSAKYADIKYFDGKTAEGDKPATMEDFKKFIKIVIPLYSIIFIILFLK